MPEPDCFLRYRMRYNAEFYYVGKIPRSYWAPVAAAMRGFKMVLSRDAMQARPNVSSCGVCVCLSITFVNSVKTNIHNHQNCFTIG